MKKLFCLGFLFLASQVAQGQSTIAPNAPAPGPASNVATNRKDDTLILELTETPEAAWRRLTQVLVERGYSISSSDKDLLTLSTHPLFVNGIGPVRAAGTVLNGTLVLRLYWNGDAAAGGVQHMLVQRRNGRAWAELETIGREIGGAARYAASQPD